MAASKPTSWRSQSKYHLYHWNYFMDLNLQSGLFPFWVWIFAYILCLPWMNKSVFGVCKSSVRDNLPFTYTVLYPRFSITRRSTSIDFAEIQLSPTLIGLSPLNSSHPSILPHTRVRPSKKCCHYNISLLKLRSAGFGYLTKDFKSPYKTRFLLASTFIA